MKNKKITTLFLDIGGVLLTNGWDHEERDKAVKHFKLDGEEVNERNHLTFDTFEEGKLTLKEYLNRVVFYEPRLFSHDDFIAFMLKQSRPYQDSIDFFKEIKFLIQLCQKLLVFTGTKTKTNFPANAHGDEYPDIFNNK